MIDDDMPPNAGIPPQAGAKDGPTLLRSASGELEIQSVRYVHGAVDKDSNCFGWSLIARIDVLNGTTEGEHVAAYFKGYRHPGATAPMWPLCSEATDLSGVGHLWGGEFDVMTRGIDPNHSRIGVGIVSGEACLRGVDPNTGKPFTLPPTYELVRLNYGLIGLPYRRRVVGTDGIERIIPDNVEHEVWMTTFVKCKIFAAVPPGAWVTWDDVTQANVGEKFDPPTGFQLQGRRDIIGDPADWTRAALAFQRDTGAIFQFGVEVVPACPAEFRPTPNDTREEWGEKIRKRAFWIADQKKRERAELVAAIKAELLHP